jgi:hypothetical protein
MFTQSFEKISVSVLSAVGKGLASGAKAASFNPLKGAAKMRDWSKVTGAAHNAGALAKQYAPVLTGAALLGRATKSDSPQYQNS